LIKEAKHLEILNFANKMKPIPFEIQKQVSEADIDDLNHVNNLRYIEWVLEISELHWKTKTPESIRLQFGWVVIEQHIYYKHAAKLGDQLQLKTWIATCEGVKSERKTSIRNSKNQLILEATTLWCFINLETHRLSRITPEIIEPYFELYTK
jgi:acyl-CoA thioester hydrolase